MRINSFIVSSGNFLCFSPTRLSFVEGLEIMEQLIEQL